MAAAQKYRMDMCHGPLLGKVIRFSVPLMIANALSLMFNAADLIVLGQFAPGEAMAAVGVAPGFTTLMLNLFWGISAGVNVLAARFTGAGDQKNVFRTVHTAMFLALIGGVVMTVVCLLLTPWILRLMSVPEKIFDKAALYLQIWSLGMPFMVIYSFGSAILRAVGDTRRPLIFMGISGLANVLMNLLFVISFKMDVAGVALATQLANVISAVLIWRALAVPGEPYQLKWKKLHIDMPVLKEMLRIGFPAGIQGAMFSISNVIIQSTVNSFGWEAIAGNTAALSIEGIIHVFFGAFALAVVSFVGQNHGARKYKRVIKSINTTLGCACVSAVVLTVFGVVFKRQLLAVYNPDPVVIDWGCIRMDYQLSCYVLLAVMEVLIGALRGLGYSLGPTIVSLMGACVLRVLWVFFIFPLDPRLENLMISYPVSWAVVSAVCGWMLWCICRRMLSRAASRKFDHLKI